MKAEDVLNLPMGKNDAGARTVRDYLKALLMAVWVEQEGFSGKRPFGNSGWDHDLLKPLIKAGAVKGRLDENGFIEQCDDRPANLLIREAIAALH